MKGVLLAGQSIPHWCKLHGKHDESDDVGRHSSFVLGWGNPRIVAGPRSAMPRDISNCALSVSGGYVNPGNHRTPAKTRNQALENLGPYFQETLGEIGDQKPTNPTKL